VLCMIPLRAKKEILDALEHLGWEATPSEVSTQSGLPHDLVTEQLNSLGSDVKGASITVVRHSEESVKFKNKEALEQALHELVYQFPKNTRSILRKTSWSVWAAEILFGKIVPASFLCFKIGFFVSLVFSVVVVTIAIIAILSRKDNRGSSGRSGTRIFSGNGPSGGPPPGGLGPGRYPRGRGWHFHDYYWFSRMMEDIILGPRYMRYRRMRVQQVEDGNRIDFSKTSDSWFNFNSNSNGSPNPDGAGPDRDDSSDPPNPDDPETGDLPSSFNNAEDSRQRRKLVKKLNWLEALISFVFGDPDPNVDLNKRRWNSLGSYIRAHGGCVAACELSPFLDGETVDETVDGQTKISFKALQHFGGVINSFDDEHFAFIFPQLIPIDREDYPNFLQEEIREFTYANDNQMKYIVGFGILNIALYILYPIIRVIAVEDVLKHKRGDLMIFTLCLNFVDRWYWLLFFYAACYFLIPLARFQYLKGENQRIMKRNEQRILAAKFVYDCKLKRKKDERYEFHAECIKFARSLRTQFDAKESSIVYETQTHRIGEETHHFLEMQKQH